MRYSFKLKVMGMLGGVLIRKELNDKTKLKAIRKEYRAILERAKDIGNNNPLLSCYAFGAYFIAMNKVTGLDPQANFDLLGNSLKKSKLTKLFMGDGKTYINEKNMARRKKWAAETHKRKYENDWEVDILDKTKDYDMGMNYTRCGICKLCRDENCFELAKYMCQLDYILFGVMGLELTRTMTLAQGCPMCDFRLKLVKKDEKRED